MTHCKSEAPALNVAPIEDRPTLTTEPSMNARLEAKMVVVRTQLGWAVSRADRSCITRVHEPWDWTA